ncbi:aminoglycoside 6-adenylyltransferase [Geomicrobium sp. JCM 19055]|uniref:aminoglycoside 6-adenylyltransferase n=1 Tax=Geomicrobium sp. JCM 19055 TaxID=1460649 RepID=UPI00045ED646|nr:aminoglycoside 6-adenylyltransferase [Geomicrobium sp. JCM 19055]GAJ97786.1 aminoglycoside 6-adenylyltransferase [Geomicrobium sp. JCM 19055]
MRSNDEMMELILSVAKRDERVRAVYMNGSRTNPNVRPDSLQDYDIVYVVSEIDSFREDADWFHIFGELIMIQQPDEMDFALGIEVDITQLYTYLMLFEDGNRIDLRLVTVTKMLAQYGKDSLTVPLLDKDGRLSEIPKATDESYWIKEPSEAEYFSCCNNFLWCVQNVAKGLCRDELPYAKQMFEVIVRADLHQMIDWWIGSQHSYRVSTGTFGKYYKQLLPNELWGLYEKTYASANLEASFEALTIACELFKRVAQEVAIVHRFSYLEEEHRKMMVYLKQLHMKNEE